MNEKPLNYPVERLPLDPQALATDLAALFTFPLTLTPEQQQECQEIDAACLALAQLIAAHLPEGKEHVVAVNNVLSAALWARHGIGNRQPVTLAAGAPLVPESFQKGLAECDAGKTVDMQHAISATGPGPRWSTTVRTDFVNCPVCGCCDMRRETDKEGNVLIECTNYACRSNGGSYSLPLSKPEVLPPDSD